MNTSQKSKTYDLEERTFEFAKSVRTFIKQLPKNTNNFGDTAQLNRSSGSIGANYIEATESLSKKDFYHRIKISRKEAKETKYWLRLVDTGDSSELDIMRNNLIQEVYELTRIFGAIVTRGSL